MEGAFRTILVQLCVFLCIFAQLWDYEVQVGGGRVPRGTFFRRPTGEVIDFSCREYQPHYRGLGGGAAQPSPIGIIRAKG